MPMKEEDSVSLAFIQKAWSFVAARQFKIKCDS